MDFKTLSRWANEELEAILMVLPEEIRDAAAAVPVTLEERPSLGGFDDQLQGDELGLFEGSPIYEEPDPGDLPRIRLFLANLWEWTEGDEQDYRDEVGTTFLHELGHYFGWDEEELEQRGLE